MTYASGRVRIRLATVLFAGASASSTTTVAFVTLTSFRRGFRFALAVLAQGAADVVALTELSFRIAAYKPLIAFIRLDQFSFRGHLFSM
jgi:hypothetical protein